MKWFSKFIDFMTGPMPTKVDEEEKSRVIEKAVKDATVELKPLAKGITEGSVTTNKRYPRSTKTAEKPVRARTEYGQFVADNKSTPNINEAWKGGKAPKPKSKVVRIKKKK